MYEIIFLIITGLSLCTIFLTNILPVIFRNSKKRKLPENFHYPRVSILKPVKTVDDEMAENIESFYKLDYPNYEVCFGVDCIDDDCGILITELKNKYPQIVTKIIPTTAIKIGNPKVDTLVKMEDHFEGDLYWITDSNVRAEKGTLTNLVSEYAENDAKMVFSTIRGIGSRTFGSLVENCYLNSFVSGNIITAWLIAKQQITVGKSMLMEKKALNDIGGLIYFRDFLAEDFIIGDTFPKKGYNVSTNFTWIENFNSTTSIKGFYGRISRWAKMRSKINPAAAFAEILLNPIPYFLIFSIAFPKFLYVLLYMSALKILFEYINFLFVNKVDRKKIINHILFIPAVITKDLVMFYAWINSFLSSSIDWRGRKMKIGKLSRITEYKN